MLRCRCKIFHPFTKKSEVLRTSTVVQIPSGCSYHKSEIFVHFKYKKHLNKLEQELNNYFSKEQKSFICTSFYFLSNNKNGSISNVTDKSKSKEKVDLKEETKKSLPIENHGTVSPDKNSVNFSEKSDKIYNSATDNIKTLKNFTIKEKSQSVANKVEEYVLDVVVLSSNNTDASKTSKIVSSIENKQVYNPVVHKVELPKAISEENLKKTVENSKVLTPSKLKDKEPKRQPYELKLGETSPGMTLNLPSPSLSVERQCKESSPNILFEKAKNLLRKTSGIKQEEDNRIVKVISLGPPKPEINLNPTRRRQTVDLNKCSTERNFITPVRAMTDFLLKPSDLEGLRKTKRRSPYENDPPITVYWRKDVEAKALDVWGSKENLLKEILKRDIERRRYQQNLFTVKRRLRDYRREQGRETEIKLEQNGLFGSSGKVVLTAIAINGTNFLFKLLAWCFTGSHSMFSEAIHSLADTINQLILAYGIHKSVQRADSDHPYGYTNMRYVASLISGVGIFCVGSGLSFYHGFVGLTDPSDLPSFYWAYFILGGSLASEGATLLVAFNSIRVGAKKLEMTFSEYVLRGQDPSVNVVLLEDLAAVIGVGIAGTCMGLSSYYNSHIPDAIGSFLVGGLLAGVASFIIYTNVAALVGRSIPQERLDIINSELESDVMIRAIHDVKGIDIGNSLVRYKAEMDFDGGELTRSYLDKQDLNQMLEEVKKMETIDELEEFMLKHGENIVDMMGGEIDRIELKLRKKHPEIRHCDLEIL